MTVTVLLGLGGGRSGGLEGCRGYRCLSWSSYGCLGRGGWAYLYSSGRRGTAEGLGGLTIGRGLRGLLLVATVSGLLSIGRGLRVAALGGLTIGWLLGIGRSLLGVSLLLVCLSCLHGSLRGTVAGLLREQVKLGNMNFRCISFYTLLIFV